MLMSDYTLQRWRCVGRRIKMHELRSLNNDLQRRIKMLLADINTHFIECQMKIQRSTVDQLGRRNALHHERKSSPWGFTTMFSFPAINKFHVWLILTDQLVTNDSSSFSDVEICSSPLSGKTQIILCSCAKCATNYTFVSWNLVESVLFVSKLNKNSPTLLSHDFSW